MDMFFGRTAETEPESSSPHHHEPLAPDAIEASIRRGGRLQQGEAQLSDLVGQRHSISEELRVLHRRRDEMGFAARVAPEIVRLHREHGELSERIVALDQAINPLRVARAEAVAAALKPNRLAHIARARAALEAARAALRWENEAREAIARARRSGFPAEPIRMHALGAIEAELIRVEASLTHPETKLDGSN